MGAEADTAWIKKLSENYSSIRLARGGVVSKTSHVLLALIGVWAVIAWQLSENLIRDVGLVLAGTIATSLVAWWVRSTQAFAERNPAQAMLDGAEFLEFHKFEAQAKGIPPSSTSILVTDPKNPPSSTGVIIGVDQ